jgi:serine phosphatase RsbU (regulator of sigma subunit)
VLLYTDGVTDTPGRTERFGSTRLTDTLAHAPADPAQIVEAIDAALSAFQASTAIDDRALLVLRHG